MTNHLETLAKLFGRTGHAQRKLAGRLLERHGIHRGQPPLLFALYHQDRQTNSELADHMQVTPATITNMVKRLEKGGFVVRERDPEDERVKRVCLTDVGRERAEDIKQTIIQIHNLAFDGFDEDELVAMEMLLEKMIGNLERALGDQACFAPEHSQEIGGIE